MNLFFATVGGQRSVESLFTTESLIILKKVVDLSVQEDIQVLDEVMVDNSSQDTTSMKFHLSSLPKETCLVLMRLLNP